MTILAHRGLWRVESEKNTLSAIERAFASGYGIETDIRDYRGELVISHNPADESAPKFDDLLRIHAQYGGDRVLALNIKADGLYLLLPELPQSAFLFDASVPEQYIYIKRGYNIFTRASEFEPAPAFWEQSNGVWLDRFTDCDYIDKSIEKLLDSGKIVSVVSPELHKLEYSALWGRLLQYKNRDNLYLCTDKPNEAEVFFK
jgi:glycerophosphoryl diester phosphodiesterase